MAAKTERLNLRLTPAQDTVLRAAADAHGETASEYVLRNAVEAAQTDLADRLVLGTTRTWVLTKAGSQEVVAFYASCTGAVLRSTAPKRFGQGQPEQLPALLLARIGVDQKHQGRGVGAATLKHFVLKGMEVSASVGARLLLVHARDEEAKSFFEHHGFVPSPVDALTMMTPLPAGP